MFVFVLLIFQVYFLPHVLKQELTSEPGFSFLCQYDREYQGGMGENTRMEWGRISGWDGREYQDGRKYQDVMGENTRMGWGRIPGWDGGEYQDGMGENTRIATLIDHILVKNLNSNSKSGIFLDSFSDHCPTYFLLGNSE